MLNSGNANGVRASESRHAVEHAHADRDFGCLRTDASRPQAIARERLEPVHQVLDERAPVIAAALLPFGAPAFGDRGDGLVAPAWPFLPIPRKQKIFLKPVPGLAFRGVKRRKMVRKMRFSRDGYGSPGDLACTIRVQYAGSA